MKPVLQALLPLLILAACGDGKKDAADQLSRQEQAMDVQVVDLSPHDIPLLVRIDRNILQEDTPKVWFNEEFGRLEVFAGDRFRINVTEEEGDIRRLKEGLDRDMLRRTTIIEETPELLVYRSQFPDEEIVFVHFYRVMEHEGRTFVVESHDQGRFNEADVRRMAGSVLPAQRV